MTQEKGSHQSGAFIKSTVNMAISARSIIPGRIEHPHSLSVSIRDQSFGAVCNLTVDVGGVSM